MKNKSISNDIFIKNYPPDHAQKAYDKGYYIEAIQVVYCWIEAKLQELLMLSRHANLKTGLKDVWNIATNIPLLQNAKVLYVIGKINKTTFDSSRLPPTINSVAILGNIKWTY